jgi:ABC-2 type transport system permease protein
MSPAIAIAKREIKTYFVSPVPYIVVAVFTMIAGFFCFKMLLIEGQAELRGYFGTIAPWILPIVMPAVTMRLISEEKGTGSMELLLTMPVRDWQVVVGKFLASLVFLAVMIGLTGIYAVSVSFIGPLDKGATLGGYFGLFMLGATYGAIGLMASSLTRNQIVAFIIGFLICFALFMVGKLTQVMPESLQPILAFLGSDAHFEQMSRGVIDSRDLLYYLSIMAVCLVVATVSLESRKWK